MEDNQPVTAHEWLSRQRAVELEFYTQNPNKGECFDAFEAQSRERYESELKVLNPLFEKYID